MSPRRWFRPFPIFWIAFVSLRHSEHPEWVLTILATVGIVMGLLWFLKKQPKPEIAYLDDAGRPILRLALAGARCLICRHELSNDVIYCGRCHTPHHRECYTYAGGCSVYACGSRPSSRAA